MTNPRPLAHLAFRAGSFLRDEQGSATIWSLLWLVGFAIMAGVAIDSTNGMREQTILQSTADVSALAGAIDLPNPLREEPYVSGGYADVKASAIDFADRNQSMASKEYGEYLVPDDVVIGNWDRDNRLFTPGEDFETADELPVNAVRTRLLRYQEERGNGVPTVLLHMIGYPVWDIATEAISEKGLLDCWDQGFMSREKVCQTNHTYWYPGFCIYGHKGIKLGPNNGWGNGSVAALPITQDGAHDGIHPNNKEKGLQVVDMPMDIPVIDKIPEIAQSILAGNSFYLHDKDLTFGASGKKVVLLTSNSLTSNGDPNEVEDELAVPETSEEEKTTGGGGGGGGGGGDAGGCQGGKSGGSTLPPLGADYNPLELVAQENLPSEHGIEYSGSVLDENTIYYHAGKSDITIDGHIRKAIIVSNGGFKIKNDSSLEDVTLVSLNDADNGKDAISANHTRFGNVDACEKGGEVSIYAMGSMGGGAGSSFYGAKVAVGGSFGFSSHEEGTYGIIAYAGGNIDFSAHNTLGVAKTNGITDDGACGEAINLAIPDEQMRVRLVQ